MEEGEKISVFVNKQELSSTEGKKWKEAILECKSSINFAGNETDEQANQFWYDSRSGLWGWVGGPIQGIIETNILYITSSCEGNWTTKWNIDQYKPTNVWVNGREVHPLDLDHFKRLRLPIKEVSRREPAAFWIIDENGDVTPERDESQGIMNEEDDNANTVTVSVEPAKWVPYNSITETSKSKRHKVKKKINMLRSGSGTIEGYFVYPIKIKCGDNAEQTEARFSQLLAFHEYVKKKFRSVKISSFPPKQITSVQTEEFAENRRELLQEYLQSVFQIQAIRVNHKALELINIQNSIHPVARARLHKQAFEQPLLALDEKERIEISNLILYAARGWPDTLTPIIVELMKILHLPDSIAAKQLISKGTIPLPQNIDNLEIQFKWDIIWAMLSEAMRFGCVDSRFHVAIEQCAYELGLPLYELLEVEGTCAEFLQQKLTEIEHKKGEKSSHRTRKILLGGAVGGGLLLVTGLIATPLFIPVFLSGTAFVAATLPASLGLSSAVLMGGSLMSIAMGPTLPLVFGAAGAGLGGLKVKKLTEGISEFGFCCIPKNLTEKQLKDIEESDQVMEERFTVDLEKKEVICNIPEAETSNVPTYAQIFDSNEVNPIDDNLPSYMKNLVVKEDKPEGSSEDSEHEEGQVDEEEINCGLRVCICIQGWLWNESELLTMWTPVRDADPSAEIYSLRWESGELKQLGRCLVKTIASVAAVQAAKYWIVAMSTLATALFAALAMPMAVITVSGAIDNSWTVVHHRAKKVGRMLAETLLERVQGNRPVTLFGVSLGSQVVYSCLKRLLELQAEGQEVKGILENVFMAGAACSSNPTTWTAFRSIVAGRLVNGYCKTDWVLGLIHRTAGMTYKAAGLDAIDSPSIENIDLTEYVPGHMSYKRKIPKILEIFQIGKSIYAPDWISQVPESVEEIKP